MTTGPETIAAAIIDAAHILARALESSETPRMAPSAANTPDPVQVDPPEAAEPSGGGQETVADAIAYTIAVGKSLDAPIPRPMTVGQLTAEHIGKRVRFEGPVPLRLVRIEHCSDGVTLVYGARGDSPLHPNTPCEVLDD